MADIRFKISGNTAPFHTELYCYGTTCLLQQKAVEQSGVTTIFGSLSSNTQYSVKIIDNIGTCYNFNLTTPAQVGTTTLATKTLSLCGVINNTTDVCSNTYTSVASTPKCINILPTLSSGESVDLKFAVTTCNCNNTTNNVTLYCNGVCKCGWINQNNIIPYTINIQYGDTICYTMSSINSNTSGMYQGCAALQITGTSNAIGFSPVLGTTTIEKTSLNVTTTTTATTQPLPAVCVYMSAPTKVCAACADCLDSWYYSRLCFSKVLCANESFRLYFTDYAESYDIVNISSDISSCSYLTTGYTKYAAINNTTFICNLAQNYLVTRPDNLDPSAYGINCTSNKYGYIDINQRNHSVIYFITRATTGQANYTNYCEFSNRSYVCLNKISNSVGANFSLSNVPASCQYTYMESCNSYLT